MIQVLQSLRNGETSLADIPCPSPGPGELTIRSRTSLISAGTERMLIEFGKANWIEKARHEPDKVRMALEKFRTDGLAATVESIRSKLDRQIGLGYSNAGVVIGAGKDAGFQPGDRVASNGPHAEVVTVPRNLCARIPSQVPDDAAAFTVVGAIALEGVRLLQPTLGETMAVSGLGLVGLLAAQILRAHGCRVLGIDLDSRKLRLAESFGVETVDLTSGQDPVAAAARFSRGRGVDGVLIAAAADNSQPVHQAALMCRTRGRIVLTGVTGLELSRDDFYKKELSFQVSCSYGPGRHDPAYEKRGHDYPFGYVRWTAQRNFEAVLDMMADGRLHVAPLITHRLPFENALDAYQLLESHAFSLGILLQYPAQNTDADLRVPTIRLPPRVHTAPAARPSVGFIGAGSYAAKTLIPAFQSAGARLVSIASAGGLSAAHAARRFGFEEATTDVNALLENPGIDAVIVATRHDSHADLVCRAAFAGKHVFVEKPLALTPEQLVQIQETWQALPEPRLLMAGFNRRFAPHTVRIRQLLSGLNQPKAFVYTVNAGALPDEHWTHDPQSGGGRIAGESCHFIDLLRFLVGVPANRVQMSRQSPDTATITIAYEDGSLGTIHYFAPGHRSYPKERLEIFTAGRVLALDNFHTLRGYGWPRFRSMKLWRQNKGAAAMAVAFLNAVRTGAPSPIPFGELIEVACTTLQAAAS